MALTAQLDIETPTGDGDISTAIDPAFWAANEAAIQGYAAAAGVTLFYQDHLQSATTTSANILSLADAKYQIQHAAQLSSAKATGPAGEGPSAGDLALAVGSLVLVAGAVAWLLH